MCIIGGLFNGEGLWDQYWFTTFVCQNYAWSCKWRDGHKLHIRFFKLVISLEYQDYNLVSYPHWNKPCRSIFLAIPKSTWSQTETAYTKVRSHHCRWPPAEKGVDRLCRWWSKRNPPTTHDIRLWHINQVFPSKNGRSPCLSPTESYCWTFQFPSIRNSSVCPKRHCTSGLLYIPMESTDTASNWAIFQRDINLSTPSTTMKCAYTLPISFKDAKNNA